MHRSSIAGSPRGAGSASKECVLENASAAATTSKNARIILEITVHYFAPSPALVDLVVVFVGRTAASAPAVDHRDNYE